MKKKRAAIRGLMGASVTVAIGTLSPHWDEKMAGRGHFRGGAPCKRQSGPEAGGQADYITGVREVVDDADYQLHRNLGPPGPARGYRGGRAGTSGSDRPVHGRPAGGPGPATGAEPGGSYGGLI